MNDKNKKFSLVIVDMQYDFCNPNGSLYVQGGYDLINKIAKFIKDNRNNIYEVIFTLDWHPYYHNSFEHCGGSWPVHCVKYSEGASIPNKLISACLENDIHTQFIRKGYTDSDEYGAFGTCHTIDRNKPDDNRLYYTFNGEYQVRDNEIGTYSDNFYVCGLCGDYCVQETIKNLRKNPHFNVVAIEDLIKSIDNGESFNKYKEETNLKTI